MFDALAPGLPSTRFTRYTDSGASPAVATATLPGKGVYLATVIGKWFGDVNHAAVAVYLIVYSGNISNDLLSAQQLGSTVKTSSNITGVELSAPTATGDVAITTTWPGGNAPIVAILQLRRVGDVL